jgi:peptide deformylase
MPAIIITTTGICRWLESFMKIVTYPHPALRFPGKPITLIDNHVRRIVDQMLEQMYEHKGLGLAAPQVALPFQLFVMNTKGDPNQREFERVYINPVISERKGIIEAEEGCLSFPGLYQKVRRAKQIRVQGYDDKGEAFDRQLTELEARIVQHETDHLHGVLYIDKFTEIGQMAARGDLAEFERDYKKAQEKGELPSNKELQRRLREMEEKGPAGAVM